MGKENWRMDITSNYTYTQLVIGIITVSIYDKKVGEASYSLPGCSCGVGGILIR